MILPGFPMPLIMGKSGFDPNTPLGTFIEGGYYMGSLVIPDDGEGGKTWALILAPKATGQTTGIRWGPSGVVTGATSVTNGKVNTAILSALNYNAAKFCTDLSINGLSDWYLPANDELVVVATNAASLDPSESYSETFYWSSTEASSSNAFRIRVSTIEIASIVKTGTIPATRAVRRVLIG